MHLTKRHSIFAVCCAVLLVSACAKQREYPSEPTGGPNELRFDISSLKSRGNTILNVEEITSMGIFAYTTGANTIPNNAGAPVGGWAYSANLLYNQKVVKNTEIVPNEWVYDPTAFWPSDLAENNSFFAYSPHSTEFATGSYALTSVPEGGGAPTLRYTLPPVVEDHKDILYAKPVYNVNLESDVVDNGMVKYHMEHTMTWVAFVLAPTSALDPDEDPADFNETYSVNWLEFMADNLPATSILNLETGLWSAPLDYDNIQWELLLSPDKAHNIVPGKTSRLTDDNNRMMLFPIDIPKGTATIDLTFYYNKNGNSYDSGTDTYIGDEYYYYLPVPETTMNQGVVVVYLINISTDGASVKFLTTNRIEDWLDGGRFGDTEDDLVEMY